MIGQGWFAKYVGPLFISVCIDFLIAFAFTRWSSPSDSFASFWMILAAIWVARFVLAIIRTLGRVISFFLFGRRALIDAALLDFRKQQMPLYDLSFDDAVDYLQAVEKDDRAPQKARQAATGTLCYLEALRFASPVSFFLMSGALRNAARTYFLTAGRPSPYFSDFKTG